MQLQANCGGEMGTSLPIHMAQSVRTVCASLRNEQELWAVAGTIKHVEFLIPGSYWAAEHI